MILVNTISNSINASEDGGSDNNCSQKVIQHFKQVYQVEQWKTEGFFEDEDLLDIPCHWLGFEPARPSLHFLLSIVYTFVFLVGFFSNVFSIYIIVRYIQNPLEIKQLKYKYFELIYEPIVPYHEL